MNELRRFLMLLWIEIRRCQAGWAALVVFAVPAIMRLQDDGPEGVVLWNEITRSVTSAHFFMSPFAAGIAVWVVGRSRRRRTQEQETSLSSTSIVGALTPSIAVMLWMMAAYIAYFIYCAVPAWRFATWGGPTYPMIVAGGLAIIFCVAVGSIIGWFGRSALLAPLTMLSVYGGMWYLSDAMNNPRFPELVPLRFFDNLSYGVDVRLPQGYMLWFCVWLIAAATVLLCAALLLRSRTIGRSFVLTMTVVAAIVSGNQVLAGSNWANQFELIAVTPVCETVSVTQVCLHPAYESLLDDAVVAIGKVVPDFEGLPGLPKTINQIEILSATERNLPALYIYDQRTINMAVAMYYFQIVGGLESSRGFNPPNATQCVIAAAMTAELQAAVCLQGDVTEITAVTISTEDSNSMANEHDSMTKWAAKMQPKYNSFMALSPEAQRAWLVANWAELRAGSLTLEDLP